MRYILKGRKVRFNDSANTVRIVDRYIGNALEEPADTITITHSGQAADLLNNAHYIKDFNFEDALKDCDDNFILSDDEDEYGAGAFCLEENDLALKYVYSDNIIGKNNYP
jgi:hypothetical protein